jgi:3-methylfumaryl-CoA hydratase
MSLPPLDLDLLKQWVGRSETREDMIHVAAVNAMAATLDKQQILTAGDPLPLLWHWLFFWAVSPASGIGPDGHPKRGGFLPPVELPRRMWAGGRLKFDSDLPVASDAKRVSRIKAIDVKTGNTGRLAFVTVAHEIGAHGNISIYEEHDIVYRDNPQPGAAQAAPKAAPTDASWSRLITPDPVLLFRYSALTFNGHRIHYDRSYTTEIEGYPGLIVHGPLIATMLMELLCSQVPQQRVREFRFRAVSPTFDIDTFSVNGKLSADGHEAHLWAANARGELTMQATALLA